VDEQAIRYVRTLVLAALLGFPVAFAAVLFQTAIHDTIHLVWEVVPDAFDWNEPPWWYVVLVPGLAGLLVAAAVRLPGHGGHSPLHGIGTEPVRPIDLGSILSRRSPLSVSGSSSGRRPRSSRSASVSAPSPCTCSGSKGPRRSCSSSPARSRPLPRSSEGRSSRRSSSSRSRW
jgi:hypothetical protein